MEIDLVPVMTYVRGRFIYIYIHIDFYTFLFFEETYVARPKVNGSTNASYCRAAFF